MLAVDDATGASWVAGALRHRMSRTSGRSRALFATTRGRSQPQSER